MWQRLEDEHVKDQCRSATFENAWGAKLSYAVNFKTSAIKQVEKLPKPLANKLMAKAAELANNPRPAGSVKLAAPGNIWRIRVGDYRIVYWIDDKGRRVDIRIVAHRREVYRLF